MLTVLSKVWDAISGGLAERFLERIFGPALFFWAVGGLAFAWNRRLSVTEFFDDLQDLGLSDAILYAGVAVIVLVISNALMEGVQFSILRALEGYVPSVLKVVFSWRVKQVRATVAGYRKEWNALADRYDTHTAQERDRYRKLDRRLTYFPESQYQLKPTALGNVLAASESYAWNRYGLASVLMWPRLWLVMDEDSRNEVAEARMRLNLTIQLLAWSVLIVVWIVWAWWVGPLFIGAVVIVYRLAVSAASGYGELMKSAFDVHHRELLKKAGLLEEDEGFVPYDRGRALTMFVKRGIRPD